MLIYLTFKILSWYFTELKPGVPGKEHDLHLGQIGFEKP